MTILLRGVLATLVLATGAARADGPGPRPATGLAGEWDASGARRAGDLPVHPGPSRPARRVTGGPDYVGSDYGLGKPAYYGLGSRPDWGRSSTD